jgi:hypothetical protein
LSLLGPNILLGTLFPNTLSLRVRSFLNVSDQVSQQCKTTGRIKLQHNFIYYKIQSRFYCLIECRLWCLIKKAVFQVIAILLANSIDTTACHAWKDGGLFVVCLKSSSKM